MATPGPLSRLGRPRPSTAFGARAPTTSMPSAQPASFCTICASFLSLPRLSYPASANDQDALALRSAGQGRTALRIVRTGRHALIADAGLVAAVLAGGAA